MGKLYVLRVNILIKFIIILNWIKNKNKIPNETKTHVFCLEETWFYRAVALPTQLQEDRWYNESQNNTYDATQYHCLW